MNRMSTYLLRKQPRHPARREPGGEGEAQRCARACRSERFAFDQSGRDAPGLPLAGPGDLCDVASGQFAAVKDGFEHRTGFFGQGAGPDFLFDPDQDAVA